MSTPAQGTQTQTQPSYLGTPRVLRAGESARDAMPPDEYARALARALEAIAQG